jgi:hypothetical protein
VIRVQKEAVNIEGPFEALAETLAGVDEADAE